MSKPILSKITSVNGLRKNEPWGYQPAAISGGPVAAWTATGLPPGITLNTTTGRLSGTPTTPGAYNVTLKARDAANVFSDALIFPIGVESLPYETSGAIRLNVNMQTGTVYSPDGNEIPLFAKSGDQILVAIGYEDKGILQEIPQLAILNVCMKVWDTGEMSDLIPLNDGLAQKTGDFDTTRYVTLLDFSDQRIRDAFDEFQNDRGTAFVGLAEINAIFFVDRPGFSTPQQVSRTSRNFKVSTYRDLDPTIRTATMP